MAAADLAILDLLINKKNNLATPFSKSDTREELLAKRKDFTKHVYDLNHIASKYRPFEVDFKKLVKDEEARLNKKLSKEERALLEATHSANSQDAFDIMFLSKRSYLDIHAEAVEHSKWFEEMALQMYALTEEKSDEIIAEKAKQGTLTSDEIHESASKIFGPNKRQDIGGLKVINKFNDMKSEHSFDIDVKDAYKKANKENDDLVKELYDERYGEIDWMTLLMYGGIGLGALLIIVVIINKIN